MNNMLSYKEVISEAYSRFKEQPSKYHDFIQSWYGLVRKQRRSRKCSQKEKEYGCGRRSR